MTGAARDRLSRLQGNGLPKGAEGAASIIPTARKSWMRPSAPSSDGLIDPHARPDTQLLGPTAALYSSPQRPRPVARHEAWLSLERPVPGPSAAVASASRRRHRRVQALPGVIRFGGPVLS